MIIFKSFPHKLIDFSRILLFIFLLPVISTGCSNGDSSELTNSVREQLEVTNGTAIVSITIVNGNIRLWPGESVQLSVIGTDMNNDIRDVSDEVSWSSSDITIATVSSSGFVEANQTNYGLLEIEVSYKDSIMTLSEVSVSDIEISELSISFADPQQLTAYTCIEAQLTAMAKYVDGFQEDISSRANWQIPITSNAEISSEGLFTSSDPQKTQETIQLSYHNSNVLTDITINTQAIQAINIVQEDDSADSLLLDIGDTTRLKAMASLKASLSEKVYNISAAGLWDTENNMIAVINNFEEQKGYIHGLSSGITGIDFSCGQKSSSNTVNVAGNSTILNLQINDGKTTATVGSDERLEVQLWLLYADGRDKFNLTDYAKWELSNDDLIDFIALNPGTDTSSYSLSPQIGQTGNLILNASFAETNYTLVVTIAE